MGGLQVCGRITTIPTNHKRSRLWQAGVTHDIASTAYIRGHTRIVASLLRHRGSGCLDAKSLNGLTALCWASLVGNTEAAR